MNFKALALGTVLTIGSIFGNVGAAEARPSTCWANNPSQGNYSRLESFGCDVDRWVGERSGSTFWNIEGMGDWVVYTDGTAKFYPEGSSNPVWYTWEYDNQGDWRFYGKNGFQFSFRR